MLATGPASLESEPALPAQRTLRAAMSKLSLSARGYDRVRKVARTIADLTGEDRLSAEHVAEALQFRVTT